MVETQKELATALSHDPEYMLLGAALSADRTEVTRIETYVQHGLSYVQHVDINAAGLAWERQAGQLRGAAERMAASNREGSQGLLVQLQRAFWVADSMAWRDFASASYADYRVGLDGRGAARSWQVRPGEPRSLTATTSEWRFDMLGLVAGGAFLGLALVAWAIWRWF
jgi:hypothetical protein